jgi:hypothetical protein
MPSLITVPGPSPEPLRWPWETTWHGARSKFKEYCFEELYIGQGLFANYDFMTHQWTALRPPPFIGHPAYDYVDVGGYTVWLTDPPSTCRNRASALTASTQSTGNGGEANGCCPFSSLQLQVPNEQEFCYGVYNQYESLI